MSTIANANDLRRLIKDFEEKLTSARSKLAYIENSCRHEFGEVEYTPEYKEGYTIPGDPPGTMGVDWRGPVYVASQTIPKWTRTCKICGKVEVTTRSENITSKKPVF